MNDKTAAWRASLAGRCRFFSLGANDAMTAILVAMVIFAQATPSYSELEQRGLEAPVAERGEFPTKAIEVAKLPAHVAKEEGKFTLFADYQDQRDGQVMLYVINNTDLVREFEAEDYDYYVKQECQDEQGNWVRSQSHEYSTCGNSFYKPRMPARSYVQILGWQPKVGRETKIRYRFYSDTAVASNVGIGRVDDAMVRFARVDQMGLRTADIETVKAALFECPWGDWKELEAKDPNWHERYSDLRLAAYRKLTELPGKVSAPVLLRCWQEFPGEYPEVVAVGIRSADPQRWLELVKSDLQSEDAKRRTSILELSSYWIDLDDPGIVDRLFQMFGKDRDENSAMVVESLASMPRATERLQAIIASDEHSRLLRDQVLFALARTNKSPGIAFNVSRAERAEYDQLAITVTIKNTGIEAFEFAYGDPSEIIAISVAVGGTDAAPKGAGRSLPPKANVHWLTPGDPAKAKRVRLEPGATHTIQIEASDYFKFPNCHGEAWVACQLPGVQRLPIQATGELPFSILSIDSNQTKPKKDIFEKAMELEKQGR